MIDLHTHSNMSDGIFSPIELINEARKQGLSAIALTDHDTIGGLENAKNESKTTGIKFIPGIEISIKWTGTPSLGHGGEMHLLGLGIFKPSNEFLSAIAELSMRRETRNKEILRRMNDLKIEADWNEVAISPSHSVGRLHFADFLVKKNIVKNRQQAFARFLSAGKPLFVPKDGMDFKTAVSLIRESGGIPILAHPMSLFISRSRLPDMIMSLKKLGLAGLEAWHPSAKVNNCRFLEKLAEKSGLYITEGSDFHGAFQKNSKRKNYSESRQLGFSHKDRKINDSILEVIPELMTEKNN